MQIRTPLLTFLLISGVSTSPSQSWVDSSLSRLEIQFGQTQKNKTVEALVRLDSALRSFVDSIHKVLPLQDHGGFWNDRYAQLGLHIGHYSGQFGHSEQFLVEAHQVNPNSPLRAYTLYSLVLGIQTSDGLGVMPSLNPAFQYLREFPHGPFAKEVNLIVANHYKDLFMVLRDGKQQDFEYKYDCYEQYIDQSPIEEQRSRTQQLAIDFYEKVLTLDPTNSYVLGILPEVRDGTVSGWSYCAD
ncbi:MAG TPA: hypothetical protein VJB38_06710 [Bacteroidota bacterium]|nr:hypothetical protein [Bacteroidota bacterium]